MTADRRRGRPRAFDETDALDAVLERFWTKGFHGTSLDELAAAAGVNRPSLYAAFGDKQSLYLKALESFGDRMRATAASALERGESVEESLTNFYNAALDTYLGKGDVPRGCMVLTTAVADAPALPEIKAALARVLAEIDGVLVDRLGRSTAPQLRGDQTILAVAELATGLLINLATRARAGEGERKLRGMAVSSASMVAAQMRTLQAQSGESGGRAGRPAASSRNEAPGSAGR